MNLELLTSLHSRNCERHAHTSRRTTAQTAGGRRPSRPDRGWWRRSSPNRNGVHQGVPILSVMAASMSAVAMPVSLALRWAIALNGYRPSPSAIQCLAALGTGLVGGGLSGLLAQLLYGLFDTGIFKDLVARTCAGVSFSMLLAASLSTCLPNLRFGRAVVAGFLGGLLGGGVFRSVVELDGPGWIPRLFGCMPIGASIGMSIRIARSFGMCRSPSLEVNFAPRESLQIPLGTQPVTFGGSSRDTIFVRGLDEGAISVVVREGKILAIRPSERDMPLAPGASISIGAIRVEVRDAGREPDA